MNTINTIKTISILNEKLKELEKKNDKQNSNLIKSLKILINDSRKIILNNITQREIEKKVSSEYDRYCGQTFENKSNEDILNISDIKDINFDKLKTFLEHEDLYYNIFGLISDDVKFVDKHFDIDESTIEIEFSNNGESFTYSVDSHYCCGGKDYIEERNINIP